jgi:pimeloyl-ACP methyl ester carboxylesterase
VREPREPAEARARALGLEPWTDGGALLGWLARHPSGGARATLVVLHGNAGSALDRAYFAAAFAEPAPGLALDVVLVEYPGYGPRPGAPTEGSIVAAARAAVARARAAGRPVLLAGESLGSAAAVLAAAEAPGEVDGLLLVVPLASVPSVARRHYGPIPAWFFRDAYRADRALPRYPGPVAVLLAGRDEVTFPDLGRALLDAAPGRKRLWVDEAATHNGVDWDPRLGRWGEMVAFLLAPTP